MTNATSFAFTQYAAGHACDEAGRWLTSTAAFPMRFAFGCEPYLLLSRQHAPVYDEAFVGYGKDRVSFSHELVLDLWGGLLGLRLLMSDDEVIMSDNE